MAAAVKNAPLNSCRVLWGVEGGWWSAVSRLRGIAHRVCQCGPLVARRTAWGKRKEELAGLRPCSSSRKRGLQAGTIIMDPAQFSWVSRDRAIAHILLPASDA